jgi:small-conductance mechanosensitive channel
MDTSAEIPASPTRIAMTVGAVTAALMLVVSMVMQILGWVVFVGGIYYGMKRFRKETGGCISYFRALSAGVQTAFFTSVICAFFMYMSATLEPSLIHTTIDAMEQQLKTYDIPAALVENTTQQMRAVLSPVVLAVFAIFTYSARGCFAGIVCAFFVQQDQPRENL